VEVKYAPGVLSAKGYNGGKFVAETKVETTGEPAAIQLTPDHATINADGEDVSVITVAVTDAQGRVVPVASNLVEFALEGPGKILGVGNATRVATSRMFTSRKHRSIPGRSPDGAGKKFPIRGNPVCRKPARSLTIPPGTWPRWNRAPGRCRRRKTVSSAPQSH